MSIEVTRKWSGRGYRQNESGWEAEIYYEVTGSNDETAVLAAVAAADGGAYYNSLHPANTNLKCNDVGISEWKSPFFATVRAGFKIPPFGQFPGGDNSDDPLLQPPRISWRKNSKTMISERQVSENTDPTTGLHGKPIVNTAGDPFDPKPTRTSRTRTLCIRRYEPLYDLALAEQLEDCINSNAGYVGPLHVGVGQCLCQSIEPVGEYESDATAVEIEYLFEIDLSETYPFEIRILDQGLKGWWSDGGTIKPGAIVNENGEAPPHDVLLDGTGKPINTNYKVMNKNLVPVAPSSPSTTQAYPLATEDYTASGGGFILIYQRHRKADFSQLSF